MSTRADYPAGVPCWVDTSQPDPAGAARFYSGLFGWQTEDLGGAEAARAIEPLCILWCIPGFTQNRWSHALKLLEG